MSRNIKIPLSEWRPPLNSWLYVMLDNLEKFRKRFYVIRHIRTGSYKKKARSPERFKILKEQKPKRATTSDLIGCDFVSDPLGQK